AVGWLAASGILALLTRTGRGFAGAAFTISLLGDGVVLGYAWHTTGGLSGDVGYLIVLHGIGSTLLASFRTGAKIALWHTVLALMISEAGAAGIVKPIRKVP